MCRVRKYMEHYWCVGGAFKVPYGTETQKFGSAPEPLSTQANVSTQPTWNETGAKWSVEDSVKFLKNIEMENYVFPMKKSGMLDKYGMAM